jgi:hypothetical protein
VSPLKGKDTQPHSHAIVSVVLLVAWSEFRFYVLSCNLSFLYFDPLSLRKKK